MHIRQIAVVFMIACLLAGCDDSTDATTPPPDNTDNAAVTAEATANVDTAPVATDEVIADATPTVEPTTAPFITADGAFYIAVSYAIDAPDQDSGDLPPTGTRWLIVTATLANRSDTPITINADDLEIIDSADNRYTAYPPDDNTQPPLVTATLQAGEDILGLARFAVPFDGDLVALAWCPGGNCDQPIQSPIP